MNKKKYEKELEILAEELRDGKLIVFVGAGVSMNSKLPSWNELIRDYAEKLGMIKEDEYRSFNAEETLDIPEIYYDKFGKIKYYEILEKRFSDRKYLPNSIHKSLKKMDLNYIITTNYDKLIEEEFKNKNIYDIITKDNELPYSKTNKAIIKMHGDLKNRNVVLKKSDYDNYEKNFPLISTFIKGLFTSNTILFIGYSLNDVNVKDIMSWINEILKDDFRKVYLIDFQENNILLEEKYKKNKLVNRISLDIVNNREETLNTFLEKLIEKKDKILKDESFNIYKNLNYLSEYSLKKIKKGSQVLIENDDMRILKITGDFEDIQKYERVFYKSRVKKITKRIGKKTEDSYSLFDDKKISDKNREIKNNLDELIKIENKFCDTINNYNYSEFKILAENYITNNENQEINKLIIVYGYMFFKNFKKAEEIIKIIIKEDKLKNVTKERIIWNYFIKNIIIEKLRINEKSLEDDESLEDKYYKYFRIQNQLYEEIFNYSTLRNLKNEMQKFFDKIRDEKKSSYLGISPLMKVIFLAKDLFYFCSLNGLYDKYFSNSDYLETIKKYVEILFIAYTNKIEEENSIFSGKNELSKFEYFDIYMMMELEYKNLNRLLFDYNINEINCEEKVKNKIIDMFENILKWRENFQTENLDQNETKDSIKKVLLVISKLNLKEEQFLRTLNIILEYNDNRIFFEKTSSIVINFRNILSSYSQYLNKNFFERIFTNIFKIKNLDEYLVDYITYYFFNKNIEKIKKTEIVQVINNSNLKIKSYFLRIIEEDYFNELKEEVLNILKDTFDLEVYNNLLIQNYITPDEKYENCIMRILDNTFKNEDILNSFYDSASAIITNLFNLLLGNFVTKRFLNKLKKYKNTFFHTYIEKKQQNILWEYALNQDNFDFSKFTDNELKFFTKSGIKNLLKKENKELSKLIKKYIKFNLPSNNVLEAYFEYTDENNADDK